MLDIALAAMAGLALALGLASVPLRSLPVTEPLAALLLGVLLGPEVMGVLDLGMRPEPALETAARIVLAMALMSAALRFSIEDIRPHLPPIVLLLTVALVGMTVITGLLAAAALSLPLAAAALLGAALAPTDPVLASSIVTGKKAEREVPSRTRIILTIESGANDGFAFGFVALATVTVLGGSFASETALVVWQLLLSVALGGALGWGAGRTVEYSERHRDMEHSAFLTLTLALALFVLGLVNLLGGEGLLAVFVAGLAYDHAISSTDRAEEWEVQEAINRYLVLPVFTLLGLALPWDAWAALGWRGAAFAGAVLLLRRLPLIAVLRGPLRLGPGAAIFVGWFGPIGVAALYYLAHAHSRGAVSEPVWAAGLLLIVTSTVLHGVTAAPGRSLYSRVEKSEDRQR